MKKVFLALAAVVLLATACNKAPEAKVNAEKEKLQKYEEMMEKVNVQLKQMEN